MYLAIHRLRNLERRRRLGLIVAVALVSAIALALGPQVPLGLDYHNFADNRKLLGIPNCLDALSNIPFVIVGIWGILWLSGRSRLASFSNHQERLPYIIFFVGVTVTGVGSFWYHLAPGNSRLPWDLLPMTWSFMSIVVALTMERISVRIGRLVFIPLLTLGMASVMYWRCTEVLGHGDYRFYLFVEFFPPILLTMIIGLFSARYTRTDYLIVAFFLFVLAKLFELYDKPIYLEGGVISGHALKHITAALSSYAILRMLQQRQPM